MVTQLDPRELKPGQRVDEFLIVRRLGSGYFGVVFEAEKRGHRFALKFACHREGSGDAAQTDARLRHELVCLLLLRHPNIVSVWGAGRWPDPRDGWLYLALELVDGPTLEQWAELTHPTAHEVVVLMDQAFAAMEHMHGRGVHHRDLNLRNLLVRTSNGEPVIIDFSVGGYTKAENLTTEALPPGTPRYRSPEAARFWEDNRSNPRARYAFKDTDDIYALGAVFYDVLTYARPSQAHQGEPIDGALFPPPSPFEVTQGRVPQALSDFIMNLISRAPEERPARAKDARRVLADLRTHQGPAWHTPFHPAATQVPRALAQAAHRLAAFARRRGWRAPVLGAGLVLVALLAAVGAVATCRAAKQTNRSSELPSVLPTQQETPPTLNPPQNAASPAPALPAPPARKASAPRTLSLNEKCTLAIATLAWLKLGCAAVQPHPDPGGACPEESLAGMRSLDWIPRRDSGRLFIFDENQPPLKTLEVIDGIKRSFGVYKDGPTTAVLTQEFHEAPEGTKLEGHLWVGGDKVYGHFLWARVPGKGRIPVCLEIGDLAYVGEQKYSGSKPGTAIIPRQGILVPVDHWSY
jgi:hypothetical protein